MTQTRAISRLAVAELARPGDLDPARGRSGRRQDRLRAGVRASAWASPSRSPAPRSRWPAQYRGRLELNHLDVYRLEQVDEVLDLGLPELLDGTAATLDRVGRRDPPGTAGRLPRGAARPTAPATTTATAAPARRRRSGRARSRALGAAHRPIVRSDAASGSRSGASADPGHRERHRAGRVRDRRARGRAGVARTRRGPSATPRSSRRRSTSSAARPAIELSEISVRGDRPRARACSPACGSASPPAWRSRTRSACR